MIIGHGKLYLISTLSLLAVLTFIGGCRRFSTEYAPLFYTHVTTARGPLDIGEPFGITFKDDVIYISDGATGTIRRIDAVGNATTMASGLNTPSAIAFLPDGQLVVADTGSHTIRKISVDGSITILAGIDGQRGSNDGPALAATFNAPVGLAVTDDGSIYVSDTYNDRIRLVRDGVVSTIAGSERGFADGAGPGAKFDTPLGIGVWGDKLLVADSGNARVRLLGPNGDVSTLAGFDSRDLIDGPLSRASFVMPTAVTTDNFGRIFVADGNAIRVIGQRILPFVETVAGNRRGYVDGNRQTARFNRPSGLAVGSDGKLYIADSDNHSARIVTDADDERTTEPIADVDEEPLPLAIRWPFDPPQNPREIAGTLGEIRGEIASENKPVWFHNGLDIAGQYGETAKFIRDETVLDPHSAENFGASRELLRMPLIGYIHLRLGRDKDDRTLGDSRFQFDRDAAGKLVGVRVPRGTRFTAGDSIGTLNSMNHVHLIAGRSGHEVNALAALKLPGISDTIPPVIEGLMVFDGIWDRVEVPSKAPRAIPLEGKVRITVDAYDRMDGNSERRKLGVYRVGYQLLRNGSPVADIDWRINFDRMPTNDAVGLAYAFGSKSGYTPDTVFRYIATNRIYGEDCKEDFLDTSLLEPGPYTLRVFAADFFGNIATSDRDVVKIGPSQPSQ